MQLFTSITFVQVSTGSNMFVLSLFTSFFVLSFAGADRGSIFINRAILQDEDTETWNDKPTIGEYIFLLIGVKKGFDVLFSYKKLTSVNMY